MIISIASGKGGTGGTGKILVALVRQKAKQIAEKQGLDYIISDGLPGIGCPVISSLTGALVHKQPVVEYMQGEITGTIKSLWQCITHTLEEKRR